MISYPTKLSEQVKFLKENRDFFLTFGPYTEPYEDKIVSKIVSEVKDPIDVGKLIHRYFKPVKVDADYIYTVKFMEDHNIVGACTEYALLTAAIFRKLGYPTAIIDMIPVTYVFQNPSGDRPFSSHSANLVYIDNKWWLYDSTNGVFTRFITLKLFLDGKMIVGFIHRDPADIGIKNRIDKYFILLKNLKDVLLIDIQMDLVNPRYYKLLQRL